MHKQRPRDAAFRSNAIGCVVFVRSLECDADPLLGLFQLLDDVSPLQVGFPIPSRGGAMPIHLHASVDVGLREPDAFELVVAESLVPFQRGRKQFLVAVVGFVVGYQPCLPEQIVGAKGHGNGASVSRQHEGVAGSREVVIGLWDDEAARPFLQAAGLAEQCDPVPGGNVFHSEVHPRVVAAQEPPGVAGPHPLEEALPHRVGVRLLGLQLQVVGLNHQHQAPE